jgi:molecular chaperone DnaJ
LRYQQGFFTVARACSQCRGTGKVITKACQTCRGHGVVPRQKKLSVKIPAGIAEGQQLRLAGEGEAGSGGGPSGHLYVVVHVQRHPYFRRDGNDLYAEIPVNFTTLALGGDVRVPTPKGHDRLTVPEGTQTGSTFRLRGKGMPDVSGRGHGDLMVTVQAVTPRKLTREQKQLLQQFAASLPQEAFEPRGEEEEHEDRNLFDRVRDIFG